MKTWKALLMLLLSIHLCSPANSQDCLQTLYDVCVNDPNLNSLSNSDTHCKCFLNIPEDDSPPSMSECRTAIQDLRNQSQSFLVNHCCDNAHTTFLHTYRPALSGSTAICSTGYIFNSDGFNPALPQPVTSSYEYITPSFTFDCRGCITELQILILGTEIPDELTLHFWNNYKRARDDKNVYERNQSFPLTIAPSVTPHVDDSLTTFAITTPVCFEGGDVFGFSLPLSYSVAVGPPGTDGEVGYEVKEPLYTDCALNELFEPTADNSLGGLPQIALKIDSEPIAAVSPTTAAVLVPTSASTSVTSQVTPTAPSGTATPAKDKGFPLIIVAAAAGGVAVVFVVFTVVLVAIVVHRRRSKWTATTNGVVKPSTGDQQAKVRRTDSLSEVTNVRLENMVNARECVNPFYDDPDELANVEMIPNSHLHRPLAGPKDSVKNPHYETFEEAGVAPGKYLPMASVGHASADGLGTVRSIYADNFRPSQWESEFGDGYHDPAALDQLPPDKLRQNAPEYDLPTELMTSTDKKQKGKPMYHVLDGRTPVKPDRYYHVLEQQKRSHSPNKHDYHELEGRPATSASSTETEGSILRQSPSSYTSPVALGLVGATNPMFAELQGATPPHHYHTLDPNSSRTEEADGRASPGQPMVFEQGIYVPGAEERKQLSEKGEEEERAQALTSWTNVKRRESSKRRGFFEQSDAFWCPATRVSKLYDQFARKKFREILREQIEITKYLGHGQFGTVARARWSLPNESSVDVAVKMMKASVAENAKLKFLQEAAIMGQFFHSNVVKLHGVVTVGEPVMIVLELMSLGDLATYLKKRPKPGKRAPLKPANLLSFSRQIALGMKYLARKGFVHRDLAARNVLLNEKLVCKISDFGMSRDLAESDYYVSKGGNVPIKWTAPEALHYRKYSTFSDVYSYGMLLYEVWSLGLRPLDSIPHTEIAGLTSEGYCQPPPPGCPKAIYQLMVQCWNPSYSDRPPFADICNYLSATDRTLLLWNPDDKTVSMRVTELGAPLEESKALYKELQHTYRPEK